MANSDDKPTETDSKEKIEQVFALIKDGKSMRETDLWGAANKFGEARTILELLATEQPRSTEEEQQIATLYERQGWEYLKESRQCLIEAMKAEKERDEEEQSTTFSNLTDEESTARLNTFSSIFSRKVETKPEEITMENQTSLEERLRNLNASLPSGFKTSDERMSDLNRGLNRLGLSLYEQKTPFSRFIEETVPKDEDEQVADIMAQAKDEVNFENVMAQNSTTGTFKKSNDDDSISDVEDDSDSDGDDLLDDEQLAMKKVRRRVVKAQMKLAEFVALMDEAEALRATEEKKEEEAVLAVNDDDTSDDISKPDSEAHFASAKKKLRAARKDLEKSNRGMALNLECELFGRD
eukprot:CAMPEP_0113616318 /NCGR_PEP_ID=MMETSP0017_2-20120614/8178_1 /TAXON_ID=2856 /ORGANISM="Cylindrotheca closterium" /LENGTH=351 /DNA_ID=CAMNT_0000525629 /DNA_START=11 /DNA_END=1066 /DNA_ORIENTATION=- /assembly_acc=CAM_ASM_000147